MGSNAIPRFLKYIFPASTNTEIALVQSLVAAGSMLLNGSYADLTGINPNVSIINNGFSSVVSLTSTQNNAGVNFTINGYQNGVPVTETIVGPNNNTTPTTIIFDIVTSITTDAAIDQVSVGIGNMGFFNIIQTDPNVMSPVYTFQMQWLVDGVTGHGYISADNVINNGLTYQTMITIYLLVLYLNLEIRKGES